MSSSSLHVHVRDLRAVVFSKRGERETFEKIMTQALKSEVNENGG